jgi:hypothetical protein
MSGLKVRTGVDFEVMIILDVSAVILLCLEKFVYRAETYIENSVMIP